MEPTAMTTIETRAVLAGAYKSRAAQDGAKLSHSYDVQGGRVLCGRVDEDSIADEYATDTQAEPTCQHCRRLDPRFRRGGTQDDGPECLRRLLRF